MPESLFTHDDPNARSEDPDVELGNEPDTSNRLPLPLTSGEVGKRTKTESISGSRANSMLKWIKKLQGVVDALSALTSNLVGPFMNGTNLDPTLQAQLQMLILEGKASLNYLATLTKTMQEGGTWPLFLLLQGKFENLCLFIKPMLGKEEDERTDHIDPFAFDASLPHHEEGGYRSAPNVFQGIDLYIRAPSFYLSIDHSLPTNNVGPGDIGDYVVTARVLGSIILYYVARSTRREKDEWIIGPAWVDQFVHDQAMYEKKAKRLLADDPAEGHTPSVLEQEALGGNSPWQGRSVEQGELGTGVKKMGDPLAMESPTEQNEDAEAAELFHRGMTAAATLSSGSSFTMTYNAAQRLLFYQRNAKKLSERILQEFKEGKIGSAEAKAAAVNGRNDYLYATREKITPTQRYASQLLKEDGQPISAIEKKVAGDLPAQYAGHGNFRKGKLSGTLKPNKADDVRVSLDADSPEWGRLGNQIGAPEKTRAARKAARAGQEAQAAAAARTAQTTLMDQPAVTEGVIRSAGRGNSKINFMAKGSLAMGAIGMVAELEQLTVEIIDAEKADKLRVAGRGLASLGGSMIGGELGAGIALGGVAWTCLLVGASLTSPYVIFLVTMVGGLAGGMAGQTASETMFDAVLDAGESGGGVLPSSMLATKGGFGGLQAEADNKRLSKQYTTEDIIETKIREIDQTIDGLEVEMKQRAGCDIHDLQRRRADLIDERAPLEEALTQIRLGLFDFGDDLNDEADEAARSANPTEEGLPNA